MINTELVKEKMREKGLTNEKLAEITGLSYATISYFHNGKTNPDTGTIIKIAEALDVPLSEILPTKAA
jgi:transcriptional regulator with XRE-family HTH domain